MVGDVSIRESEYQFHVLVVLEFRAFAYILLEEVLDGEGVILIGENEWMFHEFGVQVEVVAEGEHVEVAGFCVDVDRIQIVVPPEFYFVLAIHNKLYLFSY